MAKISKDQKQVIIKKLKEKQGNIVYRSPEDEGAAEHHDEIQSVIEATEKEDATWGSIKAAAAWVGVEETFIDTLYRGGQHE